VETGEIYSTVPIPIHRAIRYGLTNTFIISSRFADSFTQNNLKSMNFKKISDEDRNKKDWLDWWLSDDPPTPTARADLRQARVRQANQYRPRAPQPTVPPEPQESPPAGTNITINLDLSKIKLPKPPKIKLPNWPYRRLAVSLAVLTLIVVGLSTLYHHHQQTVETAKLEAARRAVTGPTRTTPSFTPLVPKDEPELAKLDPKNKDIAYDGNRDTYSFMDKLDNNNITISEQPLPANLGEPQQAINHVAKQINAKEPINLNDGVAYASSDKSGSQTIVFSAKDLLIFINSPFHHEVASYKFYIDNLQ
jgi:hypothetical protein